MVAAKLLALVLAGVAAALGFRVLFDFGTDRSSTALDAYGKWISDELDKALIEISPARATLWVALVVIIAAGVGVLAGNNLGQRIFWVFVMGGAAYLIP